MVAELGVVRVRITGGTLGGRRIVVPSSKVRPTSHMVREALFSMLGEQVLESRVLDLFAGSGALGLEAWSRGASTVCWVEKDRSVYNVLESNVQELCTYGEGSVRCVRAEVFRFLERVSVRDPFTLILADPPYRSAQQAALLEKTLSLVHRRSILSPSGLFVFEQSVRDEVASAIHWKLLVSRDFGETRILVFERGKI